MTMQEFRERCELAGCTEEEVECMSSFIHLPPGRRVVIDDKSPPGSWARHLRHMDALKPKPRASFAVRAKRAIDAALRELRA